MRKELIEFAGAPPRLVLSARSHVYGVSYLRVHRFCLLTPAIQKMKDEHARLKKLMKSAQTTRTIEARLTMQIEKQRSTIDRLEKENARLSTQVDTMRQRMAAVERQSDSSSQNAGRQRVYIAKLENELEAIE